MKHRCKDKERTVNIIIPELIYSHPPLFCILLLNLIYIMHSVSVVGMSFVLDVIWGRPVSGNLLDNTLFRWGIIVWTQWLYSWMTQVRWKTQSGWVGGWWVTRGHAEVNASTLQPENVTGDRIPWSPLDTYVHWGILKLGFLFDLFVKEYKGTPPRVSWRGRDSTTGTWVQEKGFNRPQVHRPTSRQWWFSWVAIKP